MMTNESSWPYVAFGDVVKQVKDRVDPKISGLTRYIAGEHMDTDDLRLRRWGEITDDYLGPAFHMRFKPGQVLYGSRRTYLRKVAVPDFEGICANTTFVLESKDPKVLLPELLPFIMQTESFNEHSVKQSKGSVNPYVNFSDLAWYEFPLPPLAEQRRIAEVLESIGECQDLLSLAIEQLNLASDSLFMHMVNGEVNTEFARLEDICEFVTDGDHNPPKREPKGIPHLTVKNIDNGLISEEDCTYISLEDFERVKKRYAPRTGDVIVTCVGTIGRIALVPEDYVFSADRSLAICRPNPERCLSEFALKLFSMRDAQYEFRRMSIGTAQMHLYLGDLRRIRLYVPPVYVQERILNVTRLFDTRRKHLSERLNLYDEIRQNILAHWLEC